MKTLAKMYRGQYRAVEDALETWKADHDEAMSVRDLEEVIRTCLGLNDSARRLVRSAWELGFAGKAQNPEEIGREVLPALKAGVVTWRSLAEGVEERAAQGYTVDSADRVPAALEEIRALAADFAARWPFVRKQEVERGAREIAAGKFTTGEELLREIHGEGG
jgi:hypothetical protein